MTTSRPRIETGLVALARLGRLSGWIDERSTAFCTSSSWLLAAARHLPGTPIVITVGPQDEPTALAALTTRTQRGVPRLELLGGEYNDYGRFFHDDVPAGEALADAICSWLGARRRWSLDLEQLPADEPVVAALRGRLPACTVEPGPPMPRIAGVGSDFVISQNRRRGAAKALKRLTADGRAWRQLATGDPETIARWLPAVVDVRRQRDHAAGRRSHLDHAGSRSFYESAVLAAASEGRALLDLLLIEETVAGYGLTMTDGGTHRLFDGRVAEEWQRYQGGLICNIAAVTRAAEAPDVTTFDWLRGQTQAKFGNQEIRRVRLRATSGALVTVIDASVDAVHRRVRSAVPTALVQTLLR